MYLITRDSVLFSVRQAVLFAHSVALADVVADVKPEPGILQLKGINNAYRTMHFDETADDTEILLRYLCPEISNPKDVSFSQNLRLFEKAARYDMGMLREMTSDKINAESDNEEFLVLHAAQLYAAAIRTKHVGFRDSAKNHLAESRGEWSARRSGAEAGTWIFRQSSVRGRAFETNPARIQMADNAAADLFLACALYP